MTSTFDHIADGLAKLRPPSNVEADNRQLAAGIRELGADYAVTLRNVFPKGHALSSRSLDRAEEDLQKHGYRFEPRGEVTETVISGGQPAKPAKPFAFALVSSSGRQPGVEVHASACGPPTFGATCGGVAYLVPPGGPRPGGLSVVRPGERVRIVTAYPTDTIELTADRLCDTSLRLSFEAKGVTGNEWKVGLAPGRYVVSVFLASISRRGTLEEQGYVGVLVSKTARRGIQRTPRCR